MRCAKQREVKKSVRIEHVQKSQGGSLQHFTSKQ
jgi:hypothetical protein